MLTERDAYGPRHDVCCSGCFKGGLHADLVGLSVTRGSLGRIVTSARLCRVVAKRADLDRRCLVLL